MKCPNCGTTFKDGGRVKGGKKSKRTITTVEQAKMQIARGRFDEYLLTNKMGISIFAKKCKTTGIFLNENNAVIDRYDWKWAEPI